MRKIKIIRTVIDRNHCEYIFTYFTIFTILYTGMAIFTLLVAARNRSVGAISNQFLSSKARKFIFLVPFRSTHSFEVLIGGGHIIVRSF